MASYETRKSEFLRIERAKAMEPMTRYRLKRLEDKAAITGLVSLGTVVASFVFTLAIELFAVAFTDHQFALYTHTVPIYGMAEGYSALAYRIVGEETIEPVAPWLFGIVLPFALATLVLSMAVAGGTHALYVLLRDWNNQA